MAGGTRRFLNNVIGNGADGQAYIKGSGHFIANAADGRSINNLWTGKTLGGAGRKVAAGGLVGGMGIYAIAGPEHARDREIQAMAKEEDIQSLPGTQGDGMGYTAFSNYNIHDYSPDGDLVFALHKLRHGG